MGEHNRHKPEAELIQLKAYDLWEKGGCKQGRDFDHWLDAEKAVKAKTQYRL